jgi:hypothetical protein
MKGAAQTTVGIKQWLTGPAMGLAVKFSGRSHTSLAGQN